MGNKAFYTKFESFALVDGPGVRSVLFLSGCPLRCLYCHNPETWSKKGEEITAEEAFKKLSRYSMYWKNNGGITISGGEPLLQIDFLIELFTLAKGKGYSTCIDTSGAPFSLDKDYLEKFDKLLSVTDLFLMDIKAPNNKLHEIITGKKKDNIEEMFHYLDKKNFPIWIRYVLVPGYTDNKEVLEETKSFIDSLNNVKRVEVLPYHPFAMPKYEELGIEYKLKDVFSPSKEVISFAENILDTKKYQ